METEPFYITLPSNASMDFYPTNKISQYKVKLPKSISLPQNWEVGLCELIFPANWYNVVEGGNSVRFHRRKGKATLPPKKTYMTVRKGLLNVTDFLQEMEYLLMREVNTGDTDVFSLRRQRVYIQLPPRVKEIILNDRLANALGFLSGNITQSIAASRMPQRNFISNYEYEFSVETLPEDIVLHKDLDQVFTIPQGHYKNPEELLDIINTIMVSVLSLPPLRKGEGFTLNEDNHIEVKFPVEGITIMLDESLAALLGFEQNTIHGDVKAPFAFDVKNSFYSLFIYTDIIQSQMIGDTYAKLLQVTPAPQRTNTIISHTFNPIQYVALEKNKFETIDVAIRNSAGDLVPFTTGLAIVKLHFRPRL